MTTRAHIERVDPPAGISGGEVSIEFAKLSPDDARTLSVEFDGSPAHVSAATSKRALVLVPKLEAGGDCEVSLFLAERPEAVGQTASFLAGKKLPRRFHPAASP